MQEPQRDPHGASGAVDALTQRDQSVEIRAAFGGCADRLHHKEIPGDPAASYGVGGIFHGHIVVDDEGLDPYAIGL